MQAHGHLVSGMHGSYEGSAFLSDRCLAACAGQGRPFVEHGSIPPAILRSCCKPTMTVTVFLLFLCILATSPVSIRGRNRVGAAISSGENGTRLFGSIGEQRQGLKPKTDSEIFSATLLHDTVFVNARFNDHVVAEPVAFGVLTVRFTNNLYVTSPDTNSGERKHRNVEDIQDAGWEEQDLETMMNTNYYPENRKEKKSEFGLTELRCYDSNTRTFHSFPSYPDDTNSSGTEDAVSIPRGVVLSRIDLDLYPWVEAFLQTSTLIGMDKGHVGSKNIFDKDQALSSSVDDTTDRRYKYQAVIFDEIFATDEVSLSNIRCNITFVDEHQQTWLPKKVLMDKKTKEKVSIETTTLQLKPLDFNDVDRDDGNIVDLNRRHHQNLLKISSHIEGNIEKISNVVLQAYDKDDSSINLEDEKCVDLPSELLSHAGVVALLQTGVKDINTETEDVLPALILPILELIMLPISKLLASLFGHKVVEKMHMQGGFQIREGLIKDVAETVAPRVIDGVSRMVVPGLMASVPDAVSESLMEILQTYLIEDLSPNTEEAFAIALAESLQPTVHKDIAPEAAKLLTERATRSVTHTLTRSLAHSIVPALSHTITHTPLQDYYCYFCYKHKVYCSFCNYSPTQLYYSIYYAGFYSTYFSDYYSEYFSKPEEYGFLTPDKTSDNVRDGADPYIQEDDPNEVGGDGIGAGAPADEPML